MTTLDLKKRIETEYSWYINEHVNKPNVAYVKIKWDNEDEPENNVETIALDLEHYEEGVPYIADEEVIAYVSGIENLVDMTEPENDFDFSIVELIGFDRLK